MLRTPIVKGEAVETEWAYLAGVFDGEGSITYGAGKKKQCQLTILQTERNIALLEWIIHFYERNDISYSVMRQDMTAARAAYYRVVVGAQLSARTCLEGMLPYLTLKQEKAISALEHLNAKDAAKEIREAQCRYGHSRTEDNVYFHARTGKHSCLECRRLRARGMHPTQIGV